MKKTTIFIMLITLISKVIGFGRELLLSYFYGASSVTDAYLIAITIPSIVLGFLIQSISSIYIPQYSEIERKDGVEQANKYTNNLTNVSMILLTVIVLIVLIFTDPIVKLFASGFQGETLKLTISFVRISIFSVYFIFATNLYSAFLHIKNNFLIASLVGIPHSIILIFSLYLSVKIDIIMLPIGIVFASLIQLSILTPSVFKGGYNYEKIIDFKNTYLIKTIKLAGPVMIGLSVNQINVIIDKNIASRVTQGGISALMYARYLDDFIVAIFVLSLSTVIFPNISRLASENDIINFKKTLRESITAINLIIIPASVGFMVFASPIVELVFKRGAFDATAVTLTSSALFYYSIGMLGASLRTVLSKFFFSLKDTKTPNITAGVSMVINIILNIILSRFLGIGGLALATSIAAIVSTIMMLYYLRLKLGAFGLKSISLNFFKITGSSLIMGMIAKNLFEALNYFLDQNISLILSIITGTSIYLLLISFMEIDVASNTIRSIKSKLSN